MTSCNSGSRASGSTLPLGTLTLGPSYGSLQRSEVCAPVLPVAHKGVTMGLQTKGPYWGAIGSTWDT